MNKTTVVACNLYLHPFSKNTKHYLKCCIVWLWLKLKTLALGLYGRLHICFFVVSVRTNFAVNSLKASWSLFMLQVDFLNSIIVDLQVSYFSSNVFCLFYSPLVWRGFYVLEHLLRIGFLGIFYYGVLKVWSAHL